MENDVLKKEQIKLGFFATEIIIKTYPILKMISKKMVKLRSWKT